MAEAWSFASWGDVTVVMAVSGGADSVAMLRAMARLRGNGTGTLVVAHVNHGLRADASEEDERFVRALCARLGLACAVERIEPGQLDRRQGDGLEAAAREARYARLQAVAERLGARYVAMAHTTDDQAETILHRILRGTGLAGLAGMPRARRLGAAVTLIRPLLGLRRSELVGYLRALRQPYREDETNRDLRATRNAIRHRLLPYLEQRHNPHAVDALLRLGRLAGEAQDVIDALVRELTDCSVTVDPDGTTSVCQRQLAGQPRYLVREVLMAAWRAREWPCRAMGFAEWEKLADMLGSTTDEFPSQTLPGGIRVARCGECLLLQPPARASSTPAN